MPCGHSHYTLWPFPMSSCALWAPATFLFQRRPTPLRHALSGCGHFQLLLYAMWAFPILIVHTVPHMPYGHQYALWAYPHYHQYAPWAFPILPCGYSQQAPMPRGHAQRFLFSEDLPCHDMPCGHSQLLLICPVGIPNTDIYIYIVPHMTCGHQYAPWAYPQGHQYALWAFPILPCGHSHMPMGIPNKRQCSWAFPILPCGHPRSHMPCGHSQPALMSRGPPQRFLFQWRFTLPWHALWAFPMAAYMPGGHSQSWYFILCPIWHVVISAPCWLTPMATNMPFGHFPFCPVGIPISICPVGIPNKGQCPAGTLNAFFFSEGFTCHDMPCGHSQLLLICPVGIPNPHISYYAPYVLWSSVSPVGLPPWPPICPAGIFHSILPWGHSHMSRGHSQQGLMSHGPHNAFFFSEDLTCHDMPRGHPQLLLICPVGIPNRHISHCAPYALWSSVRPVGLPPWPPICPVGIS